LSDILHVPVVIVGAGGTGLTAALAVADAGVEVLIVERDPTPLGTTAMSTGLIPAAGTPEQQAAGIADDPERFTADILAKTKGKTDPIIARRLAEESAETIAWLRDAHGVPLEFVQGWLYPGHSAMRMYGTPNRTGGELMAGLETAAERAGVMILTDAIVTTLQAEGNRVAGVTLRRPDGSKETITCDVLILACSGFGGAADMVAHWIPEMADAVFHGHPGNKGDAIRWGEELGAGVADMAAYQGHGGLAAGHGVPILWPLIMEGGFQVNAAGARFSDESTGYSEQAARVNAQAGHVAWSIYDQRCHELMLAFDDYQDAMRVGAIMEADSVAGLAAVAKLPADALVATVGAVEALTQGDGVDVFGRDFSGRPVLAGPWYAAKVTGALFHTQGGLVVDGDARVLAPDGTVLPNLFAGGGAARGISGAGADGYLAGNGLLTATTFGKLAGRAAAAQVVRSA
jgi:fumarate reductase flavoprotein subunit